MPSALLITRPENVFYLSGFRGEGILLQSGKRGKTMTLVTDPRYELIASQQIKKRVKVKITNTGWSTTLLELLVKAKIQSIGFEAEHLNLAQLRRLRSQTRSKKIRWVATEKEIEIQRQAKKPEELKQIQKACQITVRTLEAVLPQIRIGQTELALAELVRREAMRLGASDLAFPTIVAFGAAAACPHAEPSKRKLRRGEVILFDLGVRVSSYCSDLSRTFFTQTPNTAQEQAYSAVLAAQCAGINAVRSGLAARELDRVVRTSLESCAWPIGREIHAVKAKEVQQNLAQFFTHATGHGVGLVIHEWPSISTRSKDILRSGNVITVEPGVYLPGKWGIRIEDTVLVTKSAGQILTKIPKKLTVLKV